MHKWRRGLMVLMLVATVSIFCAAGARTLSATNSAPTYTTDAKGTYPAASWQIPHQDTVINAQGDDGQRPDGVTSWAGDPDDRTHSYRQFGNSTQGAYAVRKFARETKTPGRYDVYLNVRGGTTTTTTIEPLDIVFVIDVSGSMEEIKPGTQLQHINSAYRGQNGDYWWRDADDDDVMYRDSNNQRVSMEAFINADKTVLMRNKADHNEFFTRKKVFLGYHYYSTANPGFVADTSGYWDWQTKAQAMRVGLHEFMTQLNTLNAEQKAALHVGAVTFSEPTYATNGKSVALGAVSNAQTAAIDNLVNMDFSGATFTQSGMLDGEQMLNGGRPAARKMMIVLSDGVPTYSYHVTGAQMASGRIFGTDFNYRAVEGLANTAAFSGRTHPHAHNLPERANEYNVNGLTIASTWPATLGTARTIQGNVDVRALGIQLQPDPMADMSVDDVAARFRLVASTDANGKREFERAESPADITAYLLEQAKLVEQELTADVIVDGQVHDPLGTQFKMVSDQCDVTTYGGAQDPRVQLGAAGLTVTGINLGAGQEVRLHYQVQLQTQTPDFKTNYWYQLNGPTTLTPVGADPDTSVNFGVPSARAPARELEIDKHWQVPQNAELPASLLFTVQRRTKASVDPDWVGQVTLTNQDAEDDDYWEHEYFAATGTDGAALAMPAYDDNGQKLRYFVTAEQAPGYAVDIDNDIDWLTSEDDEAAVTNTQYAVTVRKYATGHRELLSGAQFTLRHLDNWQDTGTPVKLNAAVVPGKYSITETVAPPGYAVDKTPHYFRLTAAGQWKTRTGTPISDGIQQKGNGYASGFALTSPTNLVLVVNDEPAPAAVMPHTGGPGNPWWAPLVVFVLGGFAVLVMLQVKHAGRWRE